MDQIRSDVYERLNQRLSVEKRATNKNLASFRGFLNLPA